MFCHKKKADVKSEAKSVSADLAAQAGAASKQATAFVSHLADQAQELAHQGIEWATPIATETAEKVRPVVDDAVARASDTKDKVVSDYVPKAKRVALAAAAAAKESEGDLKTRAQLVQESATKALADPKPKKRGHKVFATVSLIAGLGLAGYYLWVRMQPTEDPWAEAYWDEAKETGASVKEDVADATEDAAEKADDLKEGAAEKAAEVKEAASDAATQAKEAASQAAESAKHAIKDSTEK